MHVVAPGISWLGVLPFALLLACITLVPLWVPQCWEHHRNEGLAAAVIPLPVVAWLLSTNANALRHSALDYVSFVCLLGSLFVTSGGVHADGGRPQSHACAALVMLTPAHVATAVYLLFLSYCCRKLPESPPAKLGFWRSFARTGAERTPGT